MTHDYDSRLSLSQLWLTIMTPKMWFRPIVDITTVLFCILFTILIVNTGIEHYPFIMSVTLLNWSYLVMLWKNKIPQQRCCKIEKHSSQSYAEISYLEGLPCRVTLKSTEYIVLSCYAMVVKPASYLSMPSIIIIIKLIIINYDLHKY